MYLPSKTKLKILVIYLLVIFLLFLPFKNVIRNLFSLFSHQLTISSSKISQKNEKLKKENISLKIKINESKHLKKENEYLQKALNFKESKKIDLVGVGVLSFSPSNWQRYLLINGGEDMNLKKGLLAINEEGQLLGKITEVKKTFSHLLLINDPDFKISVFVGKFGSGLLKGNLTGAEILYVEKEETIKKGDRVWVKSDSLSFPIEVGKVKSIKKRTNQLFCNIAVELTSESIFFNKIFILR